MTEFRDRLSRLWSIELTPQIRNRLAHATGAELADSTGVAELGALACRPDSLREALWQCCWVDAMERKISRVAFVEALDDAAMRSGWQAMAEAYAADRFGADAGKAMASIAGWLIACKPFSRGQSRMTAMSWRRELDTAAPGENRQFWGRRIGGQTLLTLTLNKLLEPLTSSVRSSQKSTG